MERGDGRPWITQEASHTFAPFARREGFDLTFHGLRHGYATLNLAGGTDLKAVSELMGTINVTADLYQEVIPLLKRDAAERLDGVLSRARLG